MPEVTAEVETAFETDSTWQQYTADFLLTLDGDSPQDRIEALEAALARYAVRMDETHQRHLNALRDLMESRA